MMSGSKSPEPEMEAKTLSLKPPTYFPADPKSSSSEEKEKGKSKKSKPEQTSISKSKKSKPGEKSSSKPKESSTPKSGEGSSSKSEDKSRSQPGDKVSRENPFQRSLIILISMIYTEEAPWEQWEEVAGQSYCTIMRLEICFCGLGT